MKEIILTKGFVAFVDDKDYAELNTYRWRYNNGYAIRGGVGTGGCIKMERQIMQPPEEMIVDHHNHRRFDNQRHNLRVVTDLQNRQNRTKPKGHNGKPCSSRYLGVKWQPTLKRWYANYNDKGRCIRIGQFADEIEAAKARDKAVIAAGLEYRELNFPIAN